jgi:hypothetical protein
MTRKAVGVCEREGIIHRKRKEKEIIDMAPKYMQVGARQVLCTIIYK